MLKLVNNRIIFLDFLRAFAVIAMIQGHTLDIVLRQTYREQNSFAYYLWNFNRGLTAPIFLFTAGCVFTFVFKNNNFPYVKNPRVKKGIIRALLLIAIGYLIKWPTSEFLNFSAVTQKSWMGFYSIDVLQLIGVGIILLLVIFYLQEKFRINIYRLLITSVLLLLLLSIFCEHVEWHSFIHSFPAGYLYMGEGAKFPLLPNLTYMLSGAVLGYYISSRKKAVNSLKIKKHLFLAGTTLILTYEFLNLLHHQTGNPLNLLTKTTNIVFVRTGIVLFIVLLIIGISNRINKLPRFIEVTGTYTLLIYVVHLFILYGSAWNKGLTYYFAYSFSLWESILLALTMVCLMIFIAFMAKYIEDKIRSIGNDNST